MTTIRKYLEINELEKDMLYDRMIWRCLVNVADSILCDKPWLLLQWTLFQQRVMMFMKHLFIIYRLSQVLFHSHIIYYLSRVPVLNH